MQAQGNVDQQVARLQREIDGLQQQVQEKTRQLRESAADRAQLQVIKAFLTSLAV